MILSPAVGTLYDMYGFQSTYFILGCIKVLHLHQFLYLFLVTRN